MAERLVELRTAVRLERLERLEHPKEAEAPGALDVRAVRLERLEHPKEAEAEAAAAEAAAAEAAAAEAAAAEEVAAAAASDADTYSSFPELALVAMAREGRPGTWAPENSMAYSWMSAQVCMCVCVCMLCSMAYSWMSTQMDDEGEAQSG